MWHAVVGSPNRCCALRSALPCPRSVVGRLGSFELSAAVLSTTLYNVSGLSLLLGFASAMETFCGQAYGARNYKLVGVVLQRALVSERLLKGSVGGVQPAARVACGRTSLCYCSTVAANKCPAGPCMCIVLLARSLAKLLSLHPSQILTTLLSACVAAVWTQAEPLLLFFRQARFLPCSRSEEAVTAKCAHLTTLPHLRCCIVAGRTRCSAARRRDTFCSRRPRCWHRQRLRCSKGKWAC